MKLNEIVDVFHNNNFKYIIDDMPINRLYNGTAWTPEEWMSCNSTNYYKTFDLIKFDVPYLNGAFSQMTKSLFESKKDFQDRILKVFLKKVTSYKEFIFTVGYNCNYKCDELIFSQNHDVTPIYYHRQDLTTSIVTDNSDHYSKFDILIGFLFLKCFFLSYSSLFERFNIRMARFEHNYNYGNILLNNLIEINDDIEDIIFRIGGSDIYLQCRRKNYKYSDTSGCSPIKDEIPLHVGEKYFYRLNEPL